MLSMFKQLRVYLVAYNRNKNSSQFICHFVLPNARVFKRYVNLGEYSEYSTNFSINCCANMEHNTDNVPKKTPMTHEERLALCQKLDKELDDFIENLPKRQNTDLAPDDNWQEEIEKHPFFMKKPPEPGEKLHPLYEGLQKLKYDPDENTPDDLATSYKEDGNFNFKHKNYRLAVLAYTEGIKIKSDNPEVNAILYNNRAASNYFLKNYRSCLRDCEMALTFKPDYDKVFSRAANACYFLKQYDKAVEFCDKILDKDAGDKNMQMLRQKCMTENKEAQRNLRKQEILLKKKERNEIELITEIYKRNLKFDLHRVKLTLDILVPKVPELAEHCVHFGEAKELVWPVTFVYPEYKIMEFVQEFSENVLLIEQLSAVFEQTPEWDREKKYHVDNLCVYFQNVDEKIFKVDIANTLLQIIQHKQYVISGGTPAFIILPQHSAAHENFLKKYKTVHS